MLGSMIQLNLVKCQFVLMALGILVTGLLMNFFERHLPSVFVQVFRYGKFSYVGKNSYVNYLEVPKRWFKHFYIVATLYSIFAIFLLIQAYIFSSPVPGTVLTFLDFIGTKDRTVTVNATTTCIAITLFFLQVWKRLYETCCVSVFSECKINIIHYCVGIAHYLGAATAIILEAPGFARPSFKHKTTLSIYDINLASVVGTCLFLWAWYQQYKATVILANLRKDKKGCVVTYQHKLPVGGLFNRLSSPHMFTEMLMYFALYIILWGHTIWPYVFFWVFCNQCETALLNHWWYKSTFKEYPTKRRAFLPFVL